MVRKVSKEEKKKMLESIGKNPEKTQEDLVDAARQHNKRVREEKEGKDEHPGERLEKIKWETKKRKGAKRGATIQISAEDWRRIFGNKDEKEKE